MTMTQAYSPGLEGVIAGETTLSFVNPERNSLMYLGFDIRDLVDKACYEEVAYLLLYGNLPTPDAYQRFCQELKQERNVPAEVLNHITQLPKTMNLMDGLRTAVSILSFYDADVANNSHEANVRKATRLVAKMPTLVAACYRHTQGQAFIAPNSALDHASNALYMILGTEPDAETARLFDMTLTCYADHGFNASTFAGRVTTSTLSDMHSGIVSAIGTLKGPLHGGANEEAMHMLLDIGTPDKAEAYVRTAMANKKKLMGFGHRAYKTGDPRAMLLSEKAEALCQRTNTQHWHEIARIVTNIMVNEKGIHPNVDFPTAYIYYIMGLPIPIYTPIFALARVAGWAAHIIEQLDNNRLIRPKALYTGPQHLPYVPMSQR